MHQRKSHSPTYWWRMYDSNALNLQKLAVKILSLSCSSLGCERNWSVFEQIHSKKRNRLEHQKLHVLVCSCTSRATLEEQDFDFGLKNTKNNLTNNELCLETLGSPYKRSRNRLLLAGVSRADMKLRSPIPKGVWWQKLVPKRHNRDAQSQILNLLSSGFS
ncbi:hypothetical protein VNO78_05057 [Psophocarpus tetragonolobus]|uniref:HAT C-terminal dimerisation domain-containing protein n=1 Tax=Psophocarpus tetragonolobus TaxID=3891 RepID=A0AAN9STF2_PSOTE